MLSCKSIVQQASDYADKSLPWHRRLRMKMHLLMCIHCKRFMRHFETSICVTANIGQQQASEQEISNIMDCIGKDATS